MQKNTLRIVIDRKIDDVFEFSTNPKNTHKWFQSIKEEIASEYPPKIGTIYRNRGDNKNKWNCVTVSAYNKDELFELSGDNYQVRYTYKKLAPNKTELTYCEWAIDGDLNGITPQSVLFKLKTLMENQINGGKK